MQVELNSKIGVMQIIEWRIICPQSNVLVFLYTLSLDGMKLLY